MTAQPWTGGAGSPRAWCVRADNPGPMTLEGTNTWLLLEPGHHSAVVVDPGPADEAHLQAVVAAARERDATIGLVLLTHHHLDHSEGVARLTELTGAPALAPAEGDLPDGRALVHDGLTVEVLATPGHTSDSVSFLVPDDGALLTGDTVLGRGTTVVAWPDGALAPYLSSLARLTALAQAGRVTTVLPGHGPLVPDPQPWLDWYAEHRRQRLDQVRDAVARGARRAGEVVRLVYADVPEHLWPAAELSVRAQLAYLGVESD